MKIPAHNKDVTLGYREICAQLQSDIEADSMLPAVRRDALHALHVLQTILEPYSD